MQHNTSLFHIHVTIERYRLSKSAETDISFTCLRYCLLQELTEDISRHETVLADILQSAQQLNDDQAEQLSARFKELKDRAEVSRKLK